MLDGARSNCAGSTSLVRADDHFSAVRGSFDFIFSDAVFQHIHPRRVELIFRALLDRLEQGGVCAVGFVIHTPPVRRLARWLNRTLPFAHRLVARLRGYQGGNTALEARLPAGAGGRPINGSRPRRMYFQFFRALHVTRARVFVRRGTSGAGTAATGA
jgi:hypothetical protein